MDSDTDLLRRFAMTGEEAAFSLLVARHAGMMQGVAVRCTGDHALAEEVTQTVFSILVRKARSLQHESVAGWLQRTTFLEARNARRKAARYRHTLSRFGGMPSIAPAPVAGAVESPDEEILHHLDEALTRLPARNRQLVVLRFYERKSVGEIAEATGTNHEACKKQIQRSVHRLGDLLRRQGLVTTSGGLCTLMMAQCFHAAPARAATLAAAASQATPSVVPFFIHLMNTNAIIKTSAVVLVLAAIPAAVMWQREESPKETPQQQQASQPTAPTHANTQAARPQADESAATKSSVIRKTSAPAHPQDHAIADTPADFALQIRSVLKGEVSEDEQLAFWQAVKSGDKLDRLIGEMQKTTADDASDVDSRLTLGLAYVAKIWSMPDGPEKAIWAGKAEGVWREVLTVDPQNWEAQRNIATSYSRYPDFLNKTGAAITEYEKTIALQESSAQPRKEFANSYLEMARLQVKTGDPASALSTLERGAAAHPDNAAITSQLETIKRSYKFEAPQE